jgi:hypothetical protein
MSSRLGTQRRSPRQRYPAPTEKRSGHVVYAGHFDARVIALDGAPCKLHFNYNPPDGVYEGPMEEDITVDLSTGIDDTYGGVVIDIRRPFESKMLPVVDVGGGEDLGGRKGRIGALFAPALVGRPGNPTPVLSSDSDGVGVRLPGEPQRQSS